VPAEDADGRRVVVGAAIVRDGCLLAQQRAWPAADAGRWELPGGRVEDGEGETDALVRECLEELGVHVVPGRRVGPNVPLPGGRSVLRVYTATLRDPLANPHAMEHRAVRWLPATELDTTDWLDADRVFIPHLHALVDPGPGPNPGVSAAPCT
jgi:8-oxo-dGTP diphosphatase